MNRVRVRQVPPLVVSHGVPTVPSASGKLFSVIDQWAAKFFSFIPSQTVLISGIASYGVSSIVSLTLFSPALIIQKLSTNLSFLSMPPLSVAFGWFFGKITIGAVNPKSILSIGFVDKTIRIGLLMIFFSFCSLTIIDVLQGRFFSLHRINANIGFLSGILFARYFGTAKEKFARAN